MKHAMLAAAGLSAALLLSATGAHAGITSAPALPAQLTLDWTATDDEGRAELLQATGSASIQNGKWVAAVANAGDGFIHLAEDAGIVFQSLPAWPGKSRPVWQDFTLDYKNQRVTADAYVDGVRVANDRQLFFTGGFDFGPDLMPNGKTLLWGDGSALCVLSNPGCIHVALWAPMELGTLSVSSVVPEPGTLASMMLGLGLVAWGVRRQRAC